jgi:hypothetical protein
MMFPVLGSKETVPWSLVEPHRAQAIKNHYQTLERLAQRGGLSWLELEAIINDGHVSSNRVYRLPQERAEYDKAEADARERVLAQVAALKTAERETQ